MRDHPCFSYRLPDCDEASSWCALRMAVNAADRKRRKGVTPTEAETIAFREISNEYRSRSRARRAEEAGHA